MEKRRVLKFVAAASAVTGGVTLTGNVVSASPLPNDNNTNGQAISNNQRSIIKGQVNSDVTLNLRVRSDASTSSSILGYLKAGDTFEITGEKGNWYKINFNGKSGYVSKDYTHKVSNSNGNTTATSKGKAVNLGNSTLRIRQSASTSSAILGSLRDGETFDIIAKSGQWYNIKTAGIVGFVHGDYVQVIENNTPTTPTNPSPEVTVTKGKVYGVEGSNLRVRTAPSLSASTFGYLLNGEEVEITGESGNWYAIKYKGETGYCSKDYVKKIGNSTSDNNSNGSTNTKPNTPTTFKGEVINADAGLRVRAGASTSSSILGHIYTGSKVDVIGESGSWYKINYNGKEAYVSKDYIKKVTDSNSNNNNNSGSQVTSKKGEVINASAGLRVRSEANTNSSVLGYIYTGDKVDIIGESGNWYKINYNGKEAYVSKDYIKKITDSNSNNNNNSGSQVTSKKGEVINASAGLRVRSEANTNSSVLGYIYTGDKVDITGESGNWYKINYNGKTAYVSKEYVKEVSEGNSSSGGSDSTVVENKRGKVYNTGGSGLTVRTEATTSSLALGYLMEGQVIEISGTSGDWYKIIFNGKPGYVSSKYIKIIEDLTDEESNSIFEKAFAAMKAQLGSPYVWGGSGEYLTTASLNSLKAKFPNETAKGWYVRAERYVDKGYRAFDCSGLMQWGFRQAGVVIGRTTWAQIGEGREVSLSDIKPGDLLFYSSLDHVGMYIGDGKWIESPNTNADVRIVDVPWSRVTRARRIIE